MEIGQPASKRLKQSHHAERFVRLESLRRAINNIKSIKSILPEIRKAPQCKIQYTVKDNNDELELLAWIVVVTGHVREYVSKWKEETHKTPDGQKTINQQVSHSYFFIHFHSSFLILFIAAPGSGGSSLLRLEFIAQDVCPFFRFYM
jgi:hypothetical protein